MNLASKNHHVKHVHFLWLGCATCTISLKQLIFFIFPLAFVDGCQADGCNPTRYSNYVVDRYWQSIRNKGETSHNVNYPDMNTVLLLVFEIGICCLFLGAPWIASLCQMARGKRSGSHLLYCGHSLLGTPCDVGVRNTVDDAKTGHALRRDIIICDGTIIH